MGSSSDKSRKADAGTENRSGDVRRTAAEVQAAFIRRNASAETPYCWKALAVALTKLSDNGFKVYVARLMYADPDGRNSYPAQMTLAQLLGCGEHKIRRADKELIDKNFVTQERRRRDTAVFHLIDASTLNLVVGEILSIEQDRSDATRLKNQDRADLLHLEAQDRAGMRDQENQDRANLQIKTEQICAPTYYLKPTVVEEKELHTRAHAHELDVFEKKVCRKEPAEPLNVEQVLERVAVASAAPGDAWLNVTEADGDRWRNLLDSWGYEHGQRAQVQTDRHFAHGKLKAAVAEHGRSFDSAVVTQALASTLDHMETVQQDRANGVRSEKERKGAAACRNYFEKAFKGRLAEYDKAHRQRLVDSAVMAEKARIVVEGDRRASAMKTDSLGKRLSAGEASQSQRLSASGPASQSGDRFNPEKIVMSIHGCLLNGDDANDLLDEIEGTDRKMVRMALEEASSASDSTFKASSGLGYVSPNAKVELKRIKDWCRNWLKREAAYQKHGTPEKLCGGSVALQAEKQLKSDKGAISEAFLQRLQSEYPDAWAERSCWYARLRYDDPRDHYALSVDIGESEIERIFQDIVRKVFLTQRKDKWSWDEYGPDAQRQLEEAFEAGVAELDEKAKSVIEANKVYAERMARETEDDRRQQELETQRKNDECGVVWNGGYYDLTDQLAESIWQLAQISKSEIRRILTKIYRGTDARLEPYEMREKLDEEIIKIISEYAGAEAPF